MDNQQFKQKLETVKSLKLIQKYLKPILNTKKIEDKLAKFKIYMFSISITLLIVGIGLIIGGAFAQKNHSVLVGLVVTGVILACVLSIVNIFLWIYIQIVYLRKIVKVFLTKGRLLNLYESFFRYFDFLIIYHGESFFDKNDYLVISGIVKPLNKKFKAVASEQKVDFYLDNKRIVSMNEKTHNWNFSLNLSVQAVDSLKRRPKESIVEIIDLQLSKNLEIIINSLYEAYYEKK